METNGCMGQNLPGYTVDLVVYHSCKVGGFVRDKLYKIKTAEGKIFCLLVPIV